MWGRKVQDFVKNLFVGLKDHSFVMFILAVNSVHKKTLKKHHQIGIAMD